MVDIRLPNITGADPTSQMAQMRSYLYQMVEQLNWALATLDARSASDSSENIVVAGGATMSEAEAQNTFNSLKSLIIKSADIVTAYYDEFEKKFSGMYVAQSDFGTYTSETDAKFTANSTSINQAYENIQSINSNVKEISDTVIGVTANIKTGYLCDDDNGVPIYGVEVGQTTTDEETGETLFKGFARFTANKLTFFDEVGNDLAWISGYKLYIRQAQIIGNLILGKYELDTSIGIAFKWIGG